MACRQNRQRWRRSMKPDTGQSSSDADFRARSGSSLYCSALLDPWRSTFCRRRRQWPVTTTQEHYWQKLFPHIARSWQSSIYTTGPCLKVWYCYRPALFDCHPHSEIMDLYICQYIDQVRVWNGVLLPSRDFTLPEQGNTVKSSYPAIYGNRLFTRSCFDVYKNNRKSLQSGQSSFFRFLAFDSRV